jgi:hypothetical protein
MSDDHSDEGDAGRVTAPQQDYGMRDVLTGLVVLAVGLAVTMGLPFVLA